MQGESVTNMNKGLTQAYKLVPWRGQMQWLGVVTLALVTISLIAWVYLTVSSKASIAGRDIQQYQYDKTKTEQSIAQLETDLAQDHLFHRDEQTCARTWVLKRLVLIGSIIWSSPDMAENHPPSLLRRLIKNDQG